MLALEKGAGSRSWRVPNIEYISEGLQAIGVLRTCARVVWYRIKLITLLLRLSRLRIKEDKIYIFPIPAQQPSCAAALASS